MIGLVCGEGSFGRVYPTYGGAGEIKHRISLLPKEPFSSHGAQQSAVLAVTNYLIGASRVGHQSTAVKEALVALSPHFLHGALNEFAAEMLSCDQSRRDLRIYESSDCAEHKSFVCMPTLLARDGVLVLQTGAL